MAEIVWIIVAAILAFSIAAIFAGWLKLERNIYLLFYVLLMGAFFVSFILVICCGPG